MIDLVLDEELNSSPVHLKVMGIGGAGGNAVNGMIAAGDLQEVYFIVSNTDSQALSVSSAQAKIQLGKKITKGLGAGANPDIGRRAAEEDIEVIAQHIKDTDIVFLTAGLGGGTGTGALPIIAKTAKEMGVLTVAVVTKPFLFEGRRRQKHAEEALANIKGAVDTLIVIPNQRLLEIADPKISMLNAFALSNTILKKAIKGISDIILKTGHINVDFADIRTIMKDMGVAIMGTGIASGPDRAKIAAYEAMNSPLLENVSINGAKGVLINITGSSNLELQEINEAASLVYDMVSEDATIILGSVIDDSMGDSISITLIATGLEPQKVQPKVVEKVVAATRQTPVVESTQEPEPVSVQHVQVEPSSQRVEDQPVMVQQTQATSLESDIDFDDLDTPTYLRKKSASMQQAAQQEVKHKDHNNLQQSAE